MEWWIWPLALFAVTFAIGVVAVLGGVGGGVLFVPIVGSFFPFHLDFVRGAGLLERVVILRRHHTAVPTIVYLQTLLVVSCCVLTFQIRVGGCQVQVWPGPREGDGAPRALNQSSGASPSAVSRLEIREHGVVAHVERHQPRVD